MPFSFDVHHPVRGWAVAPNVRNLEVFGGKRLNTDARGLRGAREVPFEKSPGTTRIAIFGDSFTFGEEVSDDETFAHQLERLLPGVEVLNFGVHGYGHDQELLYLREALPLYRPDVVLVGHVTDDSMRNMLAFRSFAKPRFRFADGGLRVRGDARSDACGRSSQRHPGGRASSTFWRWRASACSGAGAIASARPTV